MNRSTGVTVALFPALFAAQAAAIALSPVLPRVAADLDVSTATAGQLRTVAGLAAGISALLVARLGRRIDLRTLMLQAAALLAGGSLLSAVAPSFGLLALAQVPVGAGSGILLAAATTAVAEWVPEEDRKRVLSSALIGGPTAWVVGMPLLGVLGELSWRYGWLALPLAGSVVTAAALRGRPKLPPQPRDVEILEALREPGFARWALGELLANAGWAGTLVFAGAIFVQSYGTSLTVTGLVLAAAALAYVAGNLSLRRLADSADRRWLARLSLVLVLTVPLFGGVRSGVAVSGALFATAAFFAGARTLIGNAFGLTAAPARRLAVMATRAATNQLGYFVGAAAAGAALGAGGYTGLGLALGGFFAAAAVIQAELGRVGRGLAPATPVAKRARRRPRFTQAAADGRRWAAAGATTGRLPHGSSTAGPRS
jgi:predicted MFS family arabinose efflux permease